MIPMVNETLTRLPIGHPLAEGPRDPLVVKTLFFLIVALCGRQYLSVYPAAEN